MVYTFTKWWYYPLCWVFTRKVYGKDNIPKNTNFIVVSNHSKLIDPLFVVYEIIKKIDKKVHFIASPKWWPMLGDKICKEWAGCIPLFTPRQAYKDAKKMIRKGGIVGIFPEGHLKLKEREPKSGAIRLAIETDTPILPVKVSSKYFPFGSIITFGRLIEPEKIKHDYKNPERLMDEIYNLDVYHRIEKELIINEEIVRINQKV